MRDRDLVEGAQAIALNMQLPNGRQAKLARVIGRHLSWFEAAQKRGLGWDDIIEMLFVAGVRRGNGQRVSRGHISSLVWRKRMTVPQKSAGLPKKGQAKARKKDEQSERVYLERLSPPAHAKSPSPPSDYTASADRGEKGNLLSSDDAMIRGAPGPDQSELICVGNQKALDFMRRSASMRRNGNFR